MQDQNPLKRTLSTPLSRRELLRLVGLTTGGLLLAACTQSSPEPSDETTPDPDAGTAAPDSDPTTGTTPGTDSPQRGGRLRWGTDRTPDGFLDPALATGLPLTFANWIYEPLINIDEEFGTLIPRLAVSWEPEEGGSTWVFELRQGVRFHHGREFVADDVVHTFERILDPDFGSPGRAVFSNIVAVEAVDDYTVRFRLDAPNADFPTNVTGFQAKIVPHDLTNDEINAAPRGTGPFTIDNYANADRIVFQRNDDYWEEGKPYLDELEVVSVPEATTLINVLQAGDIDAVRIVPGALRPIVEADPNLKVLYGAPINKEYIFMRLDVEPFTDERVRRAFKLIPDRAAMTDLAWPDQSALPDDDNPIIPTSPVRAETDIWQQDLDEARRLLEEAGYGDGLEIDLWTINDQYGVIEFCLAFADWAQQAGVTVSIQGVPQDRYYAENWLEVSLGTVGWSPRTTADEQLRVAYTSDAPWNETRYKSAEFDAMLDEALAETDPQRRSDLYEQIQRKLITEGGQIIHAHYPNAAAVRQNVHGYRYHPLDDIDPRNIWLS